ncbi:transcriptional regulator [Klebsiella pneumoniae]|nr:transcriptional regulator [Klebsiella pneumoniae]OZJ89305.1 transcriptional regulator [Klebsiella pneumoniae]OZJ94690.1 transcriptional regulator [Klebsiella pneumoniae]OZK05352.1 transcriptional regulator [Klebsiella pneumoniae]OZK16028.1 transcriptional regulator [Klebsiella pneumoniae]
MISLSPPTICNSAEILMKMCHDDGLTQAEVLSRLIHREALARNIA